MSSCLKANGHHPHLNHHLKLFNRNGSLYASYSDGEVVLSSKIPTNSMDGRVEIIVNPTLLLSSLNALSSDIITIDRPNKTSPLKIHQKGFHFFIPWQDPSIYPEIPRPQTTPEPLPPGLLHQLANSLVPFSSSDQLHPSLNIVWLKLSPTNTWSSARNHNGFAYLLLPSLPKIIFQDGYLQLHSKLLIAAQKLFDIDSLVNITTDAKTISLHDDDHSVAIPRLKCYPPDYSHLFLDDLPYQSKTIINRADLISLLDRFRSLPFTKVGLEAHSNLLALLSGVEHEGATAFASLKAETGTVLPTCVLPVDDLAKALRAFTAPAVSIKTLEAYPDLLILEGVSDPTLTVCLRTLPQ